MPGKDTWRKLSPDDTKRIRTLITRMTIRTSTGKLGVVEEVTESKVTVRFSAGTTTYPLCHALESGQLTLTAGSVQKRALAIIKTNGTDDSHAMGTKHDERQKPPSPHAPVAESVSGVVGKDGFPREMSLTNNAILACLLRGHDPERLRTHLASLGLAGFQDSLQAGFEGKHALQALRETAAMLGCGYDPLMITAAEVVGYVLEACSPKEGWVWDMLRTDYTSLSRTCESTLHCRAKGGQCEATFTILWSRGMLSPASAIKVVVTGPNDTGAMRHVRAETRHPDEATVKRLLSRCPRSKLSKIAVPSDAKPTTRPDKRSVASDKTTARTSYSPRPIHVNEFLVRRSYGQHRTDGHSLEPVRAIVPVLPKSTGDPKPVEFDAFWCPKCQKYFMKEDTYLWLKRKGFICCRVVEERDLGTRKAGEGLYGDLASESILHSYGYNVNQQSDLSEAERRIIISFVIENGIQSAQDVAHLLEWLIRGRRNDSRMRLAVSRWRSDLNFVTHYHKPKRTVRVDSIFAKI